MVPFYVDESRFSLGHVGPSKHPKLSSRQISLIWVCLSLEESSSQDHALGPQCLFTGWEEEKCE